jgi:transposase
MRKQVYMQKTVRYSEAFKMQVLRELEEGRFATPVGSRPGVWDPFPWGTITGVGHRSMGKEHLMGKVIRVETAKEINEVKELRKRVRELEKALADAHLEHRFDEEYLKIACRTAGIADVEDFKKKNAGSGERGGGSRGAGRRERDCAVVSARGDEPAELLCGATVAATAAGR